jgi:hypothetical protein
MGCAEAVIEAGHTEGLFELDGAANSKKWMMSD